MDQSAYFKIHPTQTSFHRVIDWLENVNFGACLLDIFKCFDFIFMHTIILKELEMMVSPAPSYSGSLVIYC